MNQLTEKAGEVEHVIAREKGPLNLFALLEREDLFVISAPWAKEDQSTLRYLADVLKRHLTPTEMTRLSRVVVLQPSEDPVVAITRNFEVEHGQIELNEAARFGLPMKHGYIITSRRAA